MKLGGFGDDDEPPTNTRFGRLRYKSKKTAKKKASALGISGSHSHEMRGTTIHMPGRNHKKLNKALREQGMRPTEMPGDGGGMMGRGGMSDMMSDSDDGGMMGGGLSDMMGGNSDDDDDDSGGLYG
jgi:hypothetical protein